MASAKRGRRPRRALRALLWLVAAYAIATTVGGCNPSAPFDAVLNLAPVERREGLRARDDAPVLVVLQHGMCRSAWALWRLERALVQHGYEVLNESYPSTEHAIADHAERLALSLEQRLAARTGPPPRLCFVGHSMGGLVIRRYLSRPDARAADTCVFIATPHRGARLATLRKHLLAFQWFVGAKAGLELEPCSPFYATLAPLRCAHVGCIHGGSGDDAGWNDDVLGDDDGTVGVDEAQCGEQTDAIRLPLGHTRIASADASIAQVLAFLRDGRFARAQ